MSERQCALGVRFLAGWRSQRHRGIAAGCDSAYRSKLVPGVLGIGGTLNRVQPAPVSSRRAMAQEFDRGGSVPDFRSNGTAIRTSRIPGASRRDGFADWALGVEWPGASAGAAVAGSSCERMPSRTQITRHDCVEGWSAIGKWTGVPLREVLERVRPQAEARFVVFHCADPMDGSGDSLLRKHRHG